MRQGVYISAFPTTVTTYTGEPLEGPVFPEFQEVSDADADTQLRSFIDCLRRKDFGLTDVFWFLPARLTEGTVSAADIIAWMRSLYIGSYVLEKGLGVIVIKSHSDPAFEKKAYAHDESLPQEALDTPAMFIGADGKIMTVIGKKAKAPIVKVQFQRGPISLLKVGLHGDIIVGEHIEPAEKAGLFASLAAFTASGKTFLELNEKAAGAAMRALAEESGLKIDGTALYFMIGEDVKDGRDPRYWKCGSLYGYPRKSRSVMIVVVLQCEMPVDMPDPLDRVECDKARILPLDFVLQEFHKDGKLKPAFDAHVRQLKAVASVLPEIVAAL
jgi:ADP-ribose pyrophosphatase YjhB (NUDIX family)